MLRGLVLGVPLVAACGFSVTGSATDDRDSAVDTIGDGDATSGAFCIGAFPRVCLERPPSIEYTVDQNEVFDTDSGPECAPTVEGTAPNMCVVVATRITIPAGFTVQAAGSRPLVLVASGAIVIGGTLDLASHRGQKAAAGANAAVCGTGSTPSINGGGAGGSFGGLGGNGGRGGVGSTNAGSMRAAGGPLDVLRGGCAGGAGGGTSPGAGGAGGGAVALVASSLAIDGVINASGAAGSGGVAAASGGGGGGSGGAIVLDSPTIQLGATAQVFAQGAGGGEGSGSNTMGLHGGEATTAGVPAGGSGSTSSSGGDGAAGAATGDGQAGGNGTNGGGGGGGGAGRIKTTSSTPPAGGIVSPPFE